MYIIRILLAISVLVLSFLSLINNAMNLTSMMLLLMGILLLTMGVEEIRKEKKSVGYLLIGIALFNLFVSIQDFFLS